MQFEWNVPYFQRGDKNYYYLKFHFIKYTKILNCYKSLCIENLIHRLFETFGAIKNFFVGTIKNLSSLKVEEHQFYLFISFFLYAKVKLLQIL